MSLPVSSHKLRPAPSLPTFPSLRPARSRACDHCFTCGGPPGCRKFAAFQRHDLGRGERRCAPPARARNPPGVSIRAPDARLMYLGTFANVYTKNDFLKHIFEIFVKNFAEYFYHISFKYYFIIYNSCYSVKRLSKNLKIPTISKVFNNGIRYRKICAIILNDPIVVVSRR